MCVVSFGTFYLIVVCFDFHFFMLLHTQKLRMSSEAKFRSYEEKNPCEAESVSLEYSLQRRRNEAIVKHLRGPC